MKLKKINAQQKKIMLAAGFEQAREEQDMIYWRRGKIAVSLARNETINLDSLVERVIYQTAYWTKKQVYINVAPWQTHN